MTGRKFLSGIFVGFGSLVAGVKDLDGFLADGLDVGFGVFERFGFWLGVVESFGVDGGWVEFVFVREFAVDVSGGFVVKVGAFELFHFWFSCLF